MVNYSKWDNLDLGSDDDEPRTSGVPNVTKLEGPSTVTFGGGRGRNVDIQVNAPAPAPAPIAVGTKAIAPPPNRSALDVSYAKFDAMAGDISSDDDINDYYEDEYHEQMDNQRREEAEEELRNPDGTWKKLPPLRRQPGVYTGELPPPSHPPPEVVEARQLAETKTLAERTERFTLNGGREDANATSAPYMWAQTHDECVLSVIVPPETKAKDVRVDCDESHCKVILAHHAMKTATMLIDDDVAHKIDPEPRDDEELERSADGFDVPRTYGEWEVCDWEPKGRRVVRVTFRKKGLGMMTHWWRRALSGGTEIDTATLKGRKDGKAAESQRIWEEATEAFKEKVKNRQPIPIPYDGPIEDSDEDEK